MNRKSFDELARNCKFQGPAPYYKIIDGIRKEGPPHCVSGMECLDKNCPLFMWFDALFGYDPNNSLEQTPEKQEPK